MLVIVQKVYGGKLAMELPNASALCGAAAGTIASGQYLPQTYRSAAFTPLHRSQARRPAIRLWGHLVKRPEGRAPGTVSSNSSALRAWMRPPAGRDGLLLAPPPEHPASCLQRRGGARKSATEMDSPALAAVKRQVCRALTSAAMVRLGPSPYRRAASSSTRLLRTSSRSCPSSARASWAVSSPYLTPIS